MRFPEATQVDNGQLGPPSRQALLPTIEPSGLLPSPRSRLGTHSPVFSLSLLLSHTGTCWENSLTVASGSRLPVAPTGLKIPIWLVGAEMWREGQ